MCCVETDSTSGTPTGKMGCEAFPNDKFNHCAGSGLSYWCMADSDCGAGRICCFSGGVGAACLLESECTGALGPLCKDTSYCKDAAHDCNKLEPWGPPELRACQ